MCFNYNVCYVIINKQKKKFHEFYVYYIDKYIFLKCEFGFLYIKLRHISHYAILNFVKLKLICI